jgi:protein-tyrosine phosphatase
VIDLHCHLLPGLDDGATDLTMSLEMARIAVSDGITVAACTPHILPGVYNNSGPEIRVAVERLQLALADAGIPLRIVTGADVHIAPDLIDGLRGGRILALGDSRYLLVEPPHHVVPPRIDDCLFNLMAAGYAPILTHPERLSWVETHYRTIQRLAQAGVYLQLTAGSLTGRFGRRVRYWSERMLDEGLVHFLATDAHRTTGRAPLMAEAREVVSQRVGAEEATRMVTTFPQAILGNADPTMLPLPSTIDDPPTRPMWQRALAAMFG